MNARLTYSSGQQYSETLSDFDIKVLRNGTRVKVSFKTKGSDWGYLSFSLPLAKAQQLAHAINVQVVSDGAEPVRFAVTDTPAKTAAA
jgi:hypothetical protein